MWSVTTSSKNVEFVVSSAKNVAVSASNRQLLNRSCLETIDRNQDRIRIMQVTHQIRFREHPLHETDLPPTFLEQLG